MTHDFAKKPKKNQPNKKRVAAKKQTSGWTWYFSGIVTGLFICFLAYLANMTPEHDPSITPSANSKAKAVEKNSSRTKFDFYTLLPEREVIVPDQREVITASTQTTLYILQAGSFKHAEDADRQRAKLLLMGLTPKIEKALASNGEQWHRVQVGPFTDRSSLSKARNILINKGIDTLLLKRKADD
jgi:cell division protein FtsN